VIQVTLGLRPLLSLGPTLPAILEPGAALIILGAGRRQAAELKMAAVKDPVTINQCRVAA
jgi:hypothetical protein